MIETIAYARLKERAVLIIESEDGCRTLGGYWARILKKG